MYNKTKVSQKLLIFITLCVSYRSCSALNSNNNHNINNKSNATSFTPPVLRSGGWTPIPTTSKNFAPAPPVVTSGGDKVGSDSIPVQSKVQHTSDGEAPSKRSQDSEMLPIPVIKPHRHGATLGFDLPEQGLTLYLDINELATKPLAQNIGLKVVSHDSHQAQPSQSRINHVKPTSNVETRHNNIASNGNNNHNNNNNNNNQNNNKIYNSNESPLSQFVNKMQTLNAGPQKPIPKSPITVAKIQKRVKGNRNIGSYEGNGGPSSSSAQTVANGGNGGNGGSPAVKPIHNYHVGYMRPHDLQNALKHVGNNHMNGNNNNNNNNQMQTNGNNNYKNNQLQSPRTVVINTHKLNNNNNNINTNGNNNYNKQQSGNGQQIGPKNKGSALETFNPNPNKYFSTSVNYLPQIQLNNNFVPQSSNGQQQQHQSNGNQQHSRPPPSPASYSYSSLQMPIRPNTQYPVQEQEKEPDFRIPQQPEQTPEDRPVQQHSQEEEYDFKDNDVVVTTTTTTTTSAPFLPPQEEDVQQKGFDDDIELTTKSSAADDNRFEEPQRQISIGGDDSQEDQHQMVDQQRDDGRKMTTVSMPMPTTNAHFDGDDDTIVKPFPPGKRPQPQPQDLTDNTCSGAQLCQHACDARTDNLIADASSMRDVVTKLNADLLFNTFPSLEDELQNMIGFASTSGYTLILPSNEAVARLPPNLLEYWKNNVHTLAPLLDNHVVESAQSLEEMRQAQIIQPRSGVKLRVQRAHNDTYTINGERVSIGNQVAPSGGQIHVIDGILYPNSDKDIVETLKSCNRLDGFVTLAEGTGFADTLKQSGPFTVFVPSNEALQKVPDNDLDIIRSNMTALKEFLKYHVAHGAYYSNDLKDGQFIPSLIDGQYIQVGIRVDGCRRRLVEANVSPLYRADIPASNGVIHVVDWILKPADRDWCENVILPR